MDSRNSMFYQGFTHKVQEVESFRFKKFSRNFLGSLLILQEVGILPTLVYFSILGDVWLSFNALRGCLDIFSLRGCLEN